MSTAKTLGFFHGAKSRSETNDFQSSLMLSILMVFRVETGFLPIPGQNPNTHHWEVGGLPRRGIAGRRLGGILHPPDDGLEGHLQLHLADRLRAGGLGMQDAANTISEGKT